MAENGPEIKVTYTADFADLKQGSTEVKKEVISLVPEVQKVTKETEKLVDVFEDVKVESKATAPEIQKVTKETKDLSVSMDKAAKETKELAPELKNAGNSGKDYTAAIGKAVEVGGIFVTAALAIAKAIFDANQQVEAMDKSLRISSGTQENYIQNTNYLNEVSNRYKKSIFDLASGFNELTRETRGTVNEGEHTAEIFDTLVGVSDKMGVSVDETTGSFGGFIDKMKQGTVDSTGLSNEIDKRLYEAFVKVAKQMGLTAGELNEVLKASDEAVSSVLPALAEELEKSMGDIPQQNAHDLGDSFAYAWSKLTVFLDGLAKTSGAKTVFAQAADDAGDLLDQLNILNRQKGFTSAVMGLMDAGYEKLTLQTGWKGPTIEYARQQQSLQNQTPLMGNSFALPGEIGNYSKSPIKPSGEYDVIAEATKIRLEAEAAANKKLIEAAKRQAAERKRALDAISRQEVEDSKRRVAEQIAAALSDVDRKYRKNNGIVGPMSQLQGVGIDRGHDNNFKPTQSFTNPSTGGGEGLSFDHVTDQIKAMTKEWWNEKNAKDASATASKNLAIGMSGLNAEIENAINQSKAQLFVGLGESLGELVVDFGSIDNVGDRVASLLGDMISQVGKAIIAYAVTMEGLKTVLAESFGNWGVALAVGFAAVAAGAALKASASKSKEQTASKFYTGGVVGGPNGIDNINAMLSPREMVISEPDQNKLWGFIKGTYSGSMMDGRYNPGGGGGSGGGVLSVQMDYRLRGSDIFISAKKGERKGNYFR